MSNAEHLVNEVNQELYRRGLSVRLVQFTPGMFIFSDEGWVSARTSGDLKYTVAGWLRCYEQLRGVKLDALPKRFKKIEFA